MLGAFAPVSQKYFYPRSPCGERLMRSPIGVCARKISIHALLAESDDSAGSYVQGRKISIHALLAESDVNIALFCVLIAISIHALLAESDAQ